MFCVVNRPRGLGLLRLPIFAAQAKQTRSVLVLYLATSAANPERVHEADAATPTLEAALSKTKHSEYY